MILKLFGGKKGNRAPVNVAEYDVSEERLEVTETGLPEQATETPVEITANPVTETEETAQQEVSSAEGYISSIAESIGIPVEAIQSEVVPVETAAEQPVESVTEKQKMSRAEKKAAKQEAKAAAKAEKAAQKQAKKEAKKWSLGKKILVTCVVLFALGITGFGVYFVDQMWVTQEQLDVYDADFSGEIHRADGTGGLVGDDTEENVQTAPVDTTRKDGCYTFLVAARDVESGCTDVIITGRFDTKNGTINMVSIPRDTMINKGNLKVNTAYQGDLASGGNGIDGLLKEMKKILGYEIDSWAVVDVEAVEKLIDAIGGVYFDVPMDMKYTDGAQSLVIDIKAGYQKLSGADAVKVLRFRKGYANGDLGRINVQHDFIKALADQILDIGNVPNLGAAIKIYEEHVQSNLTAGNILFYAKHFLSMDTDNIQFVDMPQMMGGLVNGQSFIFINPSKWVNVINEYLNPYKEDIKQSNLNIKSSADQGASFFYTGGA